MRKIGIIGGTGVEDTSIFGTLSLITVETPFGTAEGFAGKIDDTSVYFIARHGKGHSLPPHRIPYRANIYALKKLGVTFVNTSQILDFTKSREHTFFDGGVMPVCHVDFSFPYCPVLRERLNGILTRLGVRHSKAGCYVATEGPRYETAAEVRMYGLMGGDVAGMTQMPEAVLAREAEICYANCSLVTNMGSGLSWTALSHEEVVAMMDENAKTIARIIHAFLTEEEQTLASCHCREAAHAVGGFPIDKI